MEINCSSVSDVGNVRPHNEDFLFAGKIKDNEYLFVVADGMGGHSSGEVASYKAVSLLVSTLKNEWPEESHLIVSALRRTVLEINEFIYREGIKNLSQKGMGTTLSALFIKKDRGYIAHVGDSRIYRFSNDTLEQLTDDHSLVGRLLKEGYISEQEALNHPKRNVLYQSVGLKQKIDVQTVGPFPIREGDKFLLCSDGLLAEVHDMQIEDFIRHKAPQILVAELLELAKSGVAPDNITIIAISTKPEDIIPHTDPHTAPDLTDATFPPPAKSRLKLLILLAALAALLVFIIWFASQFFGKDDALPPPEPENPSKPSSSAPIDSPIKPVGVTTDLENFLKTDITNPKPTGSSTTKANKKKTAPKNSPLSPKPPKKNTPQENKKKDQTG